MEKNTRLVGITAGSLRQLAEKTNKHRTEKAKQDWSSVLMVLRAAAEQGRSEATIPLSDYGTPAFDVYEAEAKKIGLKTSVSHTGELTVAW